MSVAEKTDFSHSGSQKDPYIFITVVIEGFKN